MLREVENILNELVELQSLFLAHHYEVDEFLEFCLAKL
jgi:hypothetical protein